MALSLEDMIRTQIANRGIQNQKILEAFRHVDRKLFVPEEYKEQAYEDTPLPIGYGQTISQPYMVALMTQILEVKKGDRILEIGTGSAYQAMILVELGAEVHSVEIVPELYRRALSLTKSFNNRLLHLYCGNGVEIVKELGSFQKIIATCAPATLPGELMDHLEDGGVGLIPLGPVDGVQTLNRYTKQNGVIQSEMISPVRFVPMMGV